MYHGAGYRKLGKKTNHRLAMFANATNSLIEHGRIETTLPKAKELRRVVERLVTKGKKGTLHDRRNAFSFLRSEEAVKKLFDDVAVRFKDRKGGYTRVLKLPETRLGDAASMAVLEFVDYVLPAQKTKEDVKKDRAAVKAKNKEAKKAKAATPKKAKSEGKGKKSGKAGASTINRMGSRGT
jgi:large subunit ribosomal protein L17